MAIDKIIKRNGDIIDFSAERIAEAIRKAADATKSTDYVLTEDFIISVTNSVVVELESVFGSVPRLPTVEQIQDRVEAALVEKGYIDVARTYIMYRADHARMRADHRIAELEKLAKNMLRVEKRDESTQIFTAEKLEHVFNLAALEYQDVCTFDEVFSIVRDRLIDGVASSDLLNFMVRACLDLVSVENVAWQHISGRLYLFDLYKKAAHNRGSSREELYGGRNFVRHVNDYISLGHYYNKFYAYYSSADMEEAGDYIDPSRDMTYGYSTILAFDRRYLLNPNNVVKELPQEMYMAIALFLAIPEKDEERLSIAKGFYDVISKQQVSLPTPTLLNARTNFHQLASCFKLNVADDLRAIYHSVENMAQISKYGGGVGVYLGHIRSRGASIRGIDGASGGVIPWVRVINDTACAVNQLGARMGAISPTLDVWHRDVLDFLNLQTETGDIRSKAFDVYPAVSVPDIFMRRVAANKDWTLFDPYEVQQLMGRRIEDLFCDEFDTLYEACEADERFKTKMTIRAKELMKRIMKTAVETGMPYVFFRDTVNSVNANKHAGNVYSTQLCTEICQNTAEPQFIEETEEDGNIVLKYDAGESVVCNLASINIAKVFEDDVMDAVVPMAMRILDNVITLNFYPIKESELTAKKYRSVGLGFMGLAEYLACQKLRYDSADARDHVDELFEKYAYTVLRESQRLAEERGAYELFEGSEWDKGIIFGRDAAWYATESRMPEKWARLIMDIKKTGLRFAYHMAPAPNTSTSGVVGTTAGLLPVYKKFYVETNAIAPIVTVAPHLNQENFWFYKEYGQMAMTDVIDMIAVIYKWIDQSISFEWMLDPSQTSPKQLFDQYMQAWEAKIKTIYYVRSLSGEMKEACESCSG